MRESLFDRLLDKAPPGRANPQWFLQCQLERLLGTRRAPLGDLGPRLGGDAAAQRSPLDDDRLLTFGLEHPGQTVVTVDLDLRTLEEIVRGCIRRHLPWVTKVEVKAARADPDKEGRVVVPLEIHVGSPRGTTLKLNLHRLARQVQLNQDSATGGGRDQ